MILAPFFRIVIATALMLPLALGAEKFSGIIVDYEGGWNQCYVIRLDSTEKTISYSLAEQGTLQGLEVSRMMPNADEYSKFLDALIVRLKDVPNDSVPGDDIPYYTFTLKARGDAEPVTKVFLADRLGFEFSLSGDGIANEARKFNDNKNTGIVSDIIRAVEALRKTLTVNATVDPKQDTNK